ncbi:hypothetical protein [Mesobacillus harenae]|nr:hypothetical protein [Mesobacillus harenae]
MTKKFNDGSRNQNSPKAGHKRSFHTGEVLSGDNSKGNKRNKDQSDKTD